jgi:hypothetical protein
MSTCHLAELYNLILLCHLLKYTAQLLTTCRIVCSYLRLPCLQTANRKTHKDEEAIGNFTVGRRFLDTESLQLLHTNVGGYGNDVHV